MRSWWRPVAFVLVVFLDSSWASIQYQRWAPQTVHGAWQHLGPGDFRITSSQFPVYLNSDLQADLDFQHTYVPDLQTLAPNAAAMVDTARRGVREIQSQLIAMDRIVRDAGTYLHLPDRLALLQAELDHRIESVRATARFTEFESRKLLDGSAGMQLIASEADVIPLFATEETHAGAYAVTVTSPGRRAEVQAAESQWYELDADERLSINGVTIELAAGLSQVEVVNRINEFVDHTNVIADINGQDGRTRLYSLQFGSDQELTVSSNLNATSRTSGFGQIPVRSSGADVVANVGSSQTGQGDYWESTQGASRGLALRFNGQFAENAHLTVVGPQGVLVVDDRSLEFLLYPALQPVDLAVRSLEPTALGIGLVANQFSSLEEISVTNRSRILDAHDVIADSKASVEQLLDKLHLFLEDYVYPDPEGSITLAPGVRLLTVNGTVRLLSAGAEVGPEATFAAGSVLAEDLLNSGQGRSGFLGIAMELDGQTHYGWIGLEVDDELGFILRDAAVQTLVGQPLTTGVVPEPTFGWGMLVVVLASWRRM